ncbi:MAG: phenylalanine--tRNA ligase subunit beta [Bacteroidales bacterium]|jgi:phenylalanyl-tRNA synthetase beta chain|nr:phenylalanine--tRNA ligase subunit beta [Bacteroidales bacterium]
MKISYNWLKDYLPTNLDVKEVENLLTFGGLEVESIEKISKIEGGLENFVVGKVIECKDHPNSDHLHLTKVDVGEEELLDIVCGAPNVEKGQKVIVAKIGAKVYDGSGNFFEIKRSKLRGEVSCGMICSEKELQISNNHDGIMVILDEDVRVGTPAKEYLNIEDEYVLEIGLTANRSDAASHIGVARDLYALIKTQKKDDVAFSIPKVDNFKIDSYKNEIKFEINPNLSPRYCGITISNVQVKESPSWLKDKLNLIGIRPINNIVDATNFVLFEIGQPLHAFDLDKIEGQKIRVTTLEKDTPFTTLDSIERKLNGEEIMICNEKEPMCMGGIYGGLSSGVGKDTKNIFIESAYFNPAIIRKASKYHQLKTDASFRYERGTDPNITIYALKRCAMLIKEIATGEISSQIFDIYPKEINPFKVELNYKRMYSLIGKEIEKTTIKNILIDLGISISEEDENGLIVLVPTNKVDVLRECDVVEEILRIYGYNNVEIPQNIKSSLSIHHNPDKEKIQNHITSFLASNGFNEIMNNSLTKMAYYENNLNFPFEKGVGILNALSKDLALMRQTLIYGGLETISYNINRKKNNIKVFEFGNCYYKNLEQKDSNDVTKRYSEEKHLTIFCTGNTFDASWKKKEEKVDFFFIKNIATNILELLRIYPEKYNIAPSTLSCIEGLEYKHSDNNRTLLTIGKIDKDTLKTFDIKQEVFVADFYWNNIIHSLNKKTIRYKEIPKVPEVRRDLALVVDESISFEDIKNIAYKAEKKFLKRNINLFDVYQGDKLPKGKKQYALSFFLQDEEKTLTDKQIDSIMDKLIKEFDKALGAKLR